MGGSAAGYPNKLWNLWPYSIQSQNSASCYLLWHSGWLHLWPLQWQDNNNHCCHHHHAGFGACRWSLPANCHTSECTSFHWDPSWLEWINTANNALSNKVPWSWSSFLCCRKWERHCCIVHYSTQPTYGGWIPISTCPPENETILLEKVWHTILLII